MSEILLCNQSLAADSLQDIYSISGNDVVGVGCMKPTVFEAYTPYAVSQNPSSIDQSVLNQLKPRSVSQELTNLSLSFGGDNVVALADVTSKLQEYNIGLMGASTSVYANRIGGFAGAVKDYQAALMEFRQAIKTNPAVKNVAKQKAYAAFQKMQRNFQLELQAVTAHSKARKGTPLTSATRATNIARSSRNVTKLNVRNHIQASNLVKLSKHAKFLGNGLAVIDFGSRVGNIHNSYKAGENWEREMFVESSSFALSVSAGALAIKAGGAALTFLMVATPVGWVGLIIGGVAVAGVAATTSIIVNSGIKNNSGSWYDAIMEWIQS